MFGISSLLASAGVGTITGVLTNAAGGAAALLGFGSPGIAAGSAAAPVVAVGAALLLL